MSFLKEFRYNMDAFDLTSARFLPRTSVWDRLDRVSAGEIVMLEGRDGFFLIESSNSFRCDECALYSYGICTNHHFECTGRFNVAKEISNGCV